MHAGRVISRAILLVSGLAACGQGAEDAADDGINASWDSDICEWPDLDGEVLVCDEPVAEFAVTPRAVAWVGGSAVYSVSRDGGATEKLRDLAVVSHVAAGDFVYYDENETILRLSDDGAVKTVYARGAAAIAASDEWVFWLSEGELWGVREPADDAPVRLSDEGGAHALYLAAQDGRIAWTTDVGELFVRNIEDGRPQLLTDRLTTVHAIAVTSDRAYVAGDGGLQEIASDGTQPRWVYSTMAVTSVAANDEWITFTPADRASIEIVARAGGDADRFADYGDAGADVYPRNLRVEGDALFWADTRILTARLPD